MLTTTQPPLVAVRSRGTPGLLARLPSRLGMGASPPRSSRWLGSVGPLHFGTFAGRASQWPWFTAGLVPAFLMATGSWLWWRRRRSMRVNA